MERNQSIDILKIIMSLLVVGLHCRFLSDINSTASYFFTQGISRIGVPVFLVISGYYFYDIKDNKKYIGWLKKLLFLYLIWMVIYAPLWFTTNIIDDIKSLLLGYQHLWYLISALEAFILLWITRKLPTLQVFLLIFFAIGGILIQYALSYNTSAHNLYLKVYMYKNAIFFCFPFLLIGTIIRKFELDKKIRTVVWLVIPGLLLLLCEVYMNLIHGSASFDILLSLYVFVPILVIAGLKLDIKSENKTLSLYSTGIYLSHIWVLEAVFKISRYSTINTLLVIIIAGILTWLLIKLKTYLKYIL